MEVIIKGISTREELKSKIDEIKENIEPLKLSVYSSGPVTSLYIEGPGLFHKIGYCKEKTGDPNIDLVLNIPTESVYFSGLSNVYDVD